MTKIYSKTGRVYNSLPTDEFWKDRLGRNYFQKRDLVYAYTQRPNANLIIDAGANLGQTTIEYATWANNVVSFEAVPTIYNLAKANIAYAQTQTEEDCMQPRWGAPFTLKANVTLHNIALGNSPGVVNMGMRNNNSGASSVANKKSNKTQTVISRTLDSFGLENADYIKIDVEGYEMNVLRGAANTIANSPNAIIQIEVRRDHLAKFGTKPEDVDSYIKSLGWQRTNIRHNGDWFYVKK